MIVPRRKHTAREPLLPVQAAPIRRGDEPARLVLPRPPTAPAPRGFPVVGTLAPVVGSLALWAVTASPYVLVFALLGPIVAVASLGDAALQLRSTLRRERRRFAAEVIAARESIAREHAAERAALSAKHPDARGLLGDSRRDPERWRGSVERELPIVVGRASVFSTLAMAVAPTDGARSGEWSAPLDSLLAEAKVVPEAPLLVDARTGIGVSGSPALACSVARGILLQLAAALSPQDYDIVAAPEERNAWLAALPHRVVESCSAPAAVMFRSRGPVPGSTTRGIVVAPSHQVLVVVADSAAALPHSCGTILRVTGASSLEVSPRPVEAAAAGVLPEFVSLEQAAVFAAALTEAAEAAGIVSAAGGLPERVMLEELCRSGTAAGARHSPRDSLACTPVRAADAPLEIDLVRDGPHAIVGGTTGSGKSELLVAWILAMAASHGPEAVTFLLVDFKGGSSFQSVQHLPHSVGLITDLDEVSARRALTSLRAELRHRERELAAAGVRSIEQLPRKHPLARLIIVVDEFAAMVQDFPELHELFADIAARGRSLGVHLILCTQRPAGVVREAVLANCALRISLRVNNTADSMAVVGTPDAVALPRIPPGRALLSVSGGDPQLVQVAIASERDGESIAARWQRPPGAAPRRPWCDPLASCIPIEPLLAGATGPGLVIGMADLPHEQRTDRAVYDPYRDGSLMVIGGNSSGKSGALAAILASAQASRHWRDAVVAVPAEQEGAWDAVTRQLEAVRLGTPAPCLLIIDDLDTLVGSLPEDYAFSFVEAVSALLREGSRVGTYLAMTARRLGPSIQSLAVLCDSKLVLRTPDRQEHVAAGGDPARFDPGLPAGAGHWHGERLQLAFAPSLGPDTRDGTSATRRSWESSPGWIVVTRRVTDLARRLKSGDTARDRVVQPPAGWQIVCLGERKEAGLTTATALKGMVVLADVETWQAHWSLLAGLRASVPMVFDGCATADFRALTGLRTLPPVIAPGSSAVWLLAPGEAIERTLPPWSVGYENAEPSRSQPSETLAQYE